MATDVLKVRDLIKHFHPATLVTIHDSRLLCKGCSTQIDACSVFTFEHFYFSKYLDLEVCIWSYDSANDTLRIFINGSSCRSVIKRIAHFKGQFDNDLIVQVICKGYCYPTKALELENLKVGSRWVVKSWNVGEMQGLVVVINEKEFPSFSEVCRYFGGYKLS